MKRELTFVVAVVAVLTLCSLQPATAQSWNLTLNSTVTSTSGLGTTSTNTNPLRFVTHGSERMRIDANGNFGIGTTSLGSSKLILNGSSSPFQAQVNGSTKFVVNSNGGVSVGSSLTPPTNGLGVNGNINVDQNHLNNGTINSSPGIIFGPTTSGEGIASKRTVGGNQFGLDFYTLFIPRLSITNTGNVGIGTTAPTKRLHVANRGTITEDSTTDGDGIVANAFGDGSSWGVSAFSQNDNGIVATTNNSSAFAGSFIGDINVTGTVFQSSDRNLKQNIVDLTSALNMISKLHPKEYEYRQDANFKLMNLPRGKHYGLVAQDVEQILPNLVKGTKFNTGKMPAGKATAAKGEVVEYKGVNYTELIPLMIKAIQELSAKNEELQKQMDELKRESTAAEQSSTNLKLSSASLDQNNPNPFAGSTTIRYSLPAGFRSARIIITENSGKAIKQVQLSTAGTGTVNIDASTLNSGTYSYSLVVDGTVIIGKKMTVIH